jgi:hypothetical protein
LEFFVTGLAGPRLGGDSEPGNFAGVVGQINVNALRLEPEMTAQNLVFEISLINIFDLW